MTDGNDSQSARARTRRQYPSEAIREAEDTCGPCVPTPTPEFELASFLSSWWGRFRDRWVTADELAALAMIEGNVLWQVGHPGLRAHQRALARILYATRDSCIGSWHLRWHGGSQGRPQRFRLEPIEEECST